MFNFFKQPKNVEVVSPNIGEQWSLVSNNGDPWEKQKITVRILDVKAGWVRYYMSNVFPDERMEIKSFVQIYYKV